MTEAALAALNVGLHVFLTAPLAGEPNLTIGEIDAARSVSFGLRDGDGTVLNWLADNPHAQAPNAAPGGRVTVAIDHRACTFDIEELAEAALSLGTVAENQAGVIDGFSDIVGWLACMTMLGAAQA